MTLLFGNRSPWRLFLSKGVFEGAVRLPFPSFVLFALLPLMHTVFFALTLEAKNARGLELEGIGVAPLLIG